LSAFRTTTGLTSWGRVDRPRQDVATPRWADELAGLVGGERLLAVGLGRSYGDSGLNPDGRVVAMRGLDRVHGFDAATGVVRADAGLSLDDLIRLALPHGWFPAVVPGTKYVTLGGAIANDIHGKNHHREGTFGRHVRRLCLLRTDGSVRELAPGDPLFAATVGGLGLTGVIAWAEIQLSPVSGAWMASEDIAFNRLSEFFDLAEASEAGFDYTVSWIDCTTRNGRGIFSRANPDGSPDRTPHDPPKIALPLDFPSFALNPLTLKAFNTFRFAAKSAMAGKKTVHYETFQFPLDAIGQWNRLYGPKGFYQYQCAIPSAAARDATAELMSQIARSGQGSFLAVLKTFGDVPSPGLLSFPIKGATLALDFQNGGDATLRLLERLDRVVLEAGGRLYPAKDGRISAAMFRASYPNLEEFMKHRDPGLTSAFWRRVAA
jgi:L-gulonolactone oxidase